MKIFKCALIIIALPIMVSADDLINSAPLTGTFTNNADVGEFSNLSTISQAMINEFNSTVDNGMSNNINATIGTFMDNRGDIISGNMENDGVVSDRMENTVSGRITGNMINTGTLGSFMQNQGVITGEMINDGTITDGMKNSSLGSISSNMVNNGSIKTNMENQGSINASLINNGYIAGNIINEGNIQGNIQNYGTVHGGLINRSTTGSEASVSQMINYGNVGYMLNEGANVIQLYNSGKVKGSVINNGSAISMGNSSTGVIDGSFGNEGTLSGDGGIENHGIVLGDIFNSGTMADTFMTNEQNGVVQGSMINSGTMSGDNYPADMTNAGIVYQNMVNTNIAQEMINSGVIEGYLYNSGYVSNHIRNTGEIGGGIINSGVVGGYIYLGDTSLTLIGNSASVIGTISGSSDSSVYVGNTTTPANYIAKSGNNANIGTLDVSKNSSLKLTEGVSWAVSGANSDAISNEGTIYLADDTVLGGNLTNSGNIELDGNDTVSSEIGGNVTNSGLIILNSTNESAGNSLTIDGNYVGLTGSSLSLGTLLYGDNSLTDELNIRGNTSGSSIVYVSNEGGAGALTLDGIRIISVGGSSDGAFVLGNRVVAGAYDYVLRKGDEHGTDTGDWFLTSYDTPTPTPAPTPAPGTRMVRPEVGSYIANLRAANTLFSISLRDREGEQKFAGSSAANHNAPGMWLRNEGGYNLISTSDGQNRTRSARYVLQLGSDVATWTTDGANRFSLGLMGGYASQHSNTRNALTGNRSQADVNGYSAGAYATWFQNGAKKTGFYADSWMQYSWFTNQVKGDDLEAEHYLSRGLSASLEGGYALQLTQWKSGQETDNALYIEPHAQAVWSEVDADGFREFNGTRVSGTGNDSVQLKVGVRTYLNVKSRLEHNAAREFQPFVEVNWIYNTKQYGVRMNDVAFRAAGDRNIGELKTGLEARLGKSFSGWVAIAQQVGGAEYHDTTGLLGIRFTF